jgi:hypothetical protein
MADEDDDRALKIRQALEESQRQEREERDAALARQQQTDAAIAETLAERNTDE